MVLAKSSSCFVKNTGWICLGLLKRTAVSVVSGTVLSCKCDGCIGTDTRSIQWNIHQNLTMNMLKPCRGLLGLLDFGLVLVRSRFAFENYQPANPVSGTTGAVAGGYCSIVRQGC